MGAGWFSDGWVIAFLFCWVSCSGKWRWVFFFFECGSICFDWCRTIKRTKR